MFDEYVEKLAGISQKEAIELLTGKTLGNIEFLGISERTSSYQYSWRNDIRRLHITCRCARCGDITERDINSVRKSIRSGKLDCNKCVKISEPQDLRGQKFHSLTVIERVGEWRGTKTLWRVRCDLCGEESVIDHHHLGQTKSCACTRTKNIISGHNINAQLHAGGSYLSAMSDSRALNKNNTSGVRGVSARTDQNGNTVYRAYITYKGKQYSLGLHSTLESAIDARKSAEQKIYGDYTKWYAEHYPEQWERYTKKRNKGE